MIPLADLIDSDLLPPLLQDFERIIGLAATLDLVRAYGGLRIYIPTPARVQPDHPIARAYETHKTARELAAEHRMTERQIERILAAAGVKAPVDRRQGSLF
jgi:Mor family transcriptional regulator